MSVNTKILEDLEKLKTPINFPGLSEEEIFKNVMLPAIEKANPDLAEYFDYLRSAKDIDGEAEIKKWIDQKKKELIPFIKEKIEVIKNEIGFITTNTPRLIETIGFTIVTSVASLVTIASTAPLLPSGPATAAAMLAQTIPDLKSKMGSLKGQSDALKKSCFNLLDAAEKIYFPLPAPITTAIGVIGTLDALIDKIPIPS